MTVLSPLRAALGLMLLASCLGPRVAGDQKEPRSSVEKARSRLEAISKKKVQLWVVVHVRAHKTLKGDGSVDEARLVEDALANADAVVDGGGDMIVLINSRCELALYERVIAAVRTKHPRFPLGLSALSYGPSNLTEGFRLAKKFSAQMVWTEVAPGEAFEYEEDDGRYVPGVTTPPELAYQAQQAQPSVFHSSGVHMKYTRSTDGKSFEDSLRSALGRVDGINITGPKTAVLAEVEHVQKARRVVGRYPMGLASGVSVENISSVIPFIDYAIVGTSLKDPANPLRTSTGRVRALRVKMDELTVKAGEP